MLVRCTRKRPPPQRLRSCRLLSSNHFVFDWNGQACTLRRSEVASRTASLPATPSNSAGNATAHAESEPATDAMTILIMDVSLIRSIGGTEKHPKSPKNKVPYRRPYRQNLMQTFAAHGQLSLICSSPPKNHGRRESPGNTVEAPLL